jgi:hypothetical protein
MPHLRRLCSLVAVATLTVTGLATLVTSPAQAAGSDPRPVTIGAGWLEGQLTGGLLHNDQYDFDDYGLSVDAGLALAALGDHTSAVHDISTAVAAHIDDYIAYPGHTLAGSIAKAAAFAIEAGDDPTAYGGHDLIADLEARVSGVGPTTGRIQDAYTPDPPYEVDFANVLGQAYAVRALAHDSSTKTADATAFLIQQQCPAGFYRLNFADVGDDQQSCAAGIAQGDSPADTDATAIATLMLDRSGIDTKAAGLAIARAEAWLLAHQRADGSFGGGTSTEASNANSTGLAGWVLGELGDTAAATRAAAWVRAHQADEVPGCPTALGGTATGAIAYDDSGLASGRAAGITVEATDQWRRATTQSLPVLVFAAPAAGTLSVTGPSGYVRAGTTASYGIDGAAPGETICVRGIGAAHPVAAGPSGRTTVSVGLPAGTANRTLTASDRAGSSASIVTAVLGAKTLTVRPRHKTAHRRARLHVVVRGLAPGEQVTLRFRGRTVRAGKATRAGTFVRDIRVGRKLGKARIVARGEFAAIRHGRAVIRVVR